MLRLGSAFAVIFSILSTLGNQADGQVIPWRNDLNAARAEAAQSGRLVLVHFWAPWCGPCKRLEQTVFNQPAVAQALASGYVPVKVDADKNPDLARACGIQGVPHDVILTSDGRMVEKTVSPSTADAYVSRMSQIAAAYHQTVRITAPKPASNAVAAGTQHNPVYANLVPSRALSPKQPPATTTNPTATNGYVSRPNYIVGTDAQHASLPRNMPGNPNLSLPAVSPTISPTPPSKTNVILPPRPQPQALMGPSAGTQQNHVANTPPQNAILPVQPAVQPNNVVVPPQIQPSVTPTSVTPVAQLSVAPPSNTTLSTAVPADSVASLPTDSPPLGMEGYCPVTLKNSSLPDGDTRRWVKGDLRWGAVHRGRTYLFAGQAERDLFLRPGNADIFAPVLSGMDPVLAFDQHVMVSGKRMHGVSYRDMVFLFSSEATLQRFSQNAEFYTGNVRQAMNMGQPTAIR